MTAKYYVVGILLTAAALAATIAAYPQLPATVTTHWDIHGQPNGYSPKWTMFLIGPGIMAMTLFLTWLMPWLSPKHFGVEGFRSTYLQIMLIVVVLWAYLDGVLLWTATGHSGNVSRAMLGGVCVLFALLGNLIRREHDRPCKFYRDRPRRQPTPLRSARLSRRTAHQYLAIVLAGSKDQLIRCTESGWIACGLLQLRTLQLPSSRVSMIDSTLRA